MVAELHLARLLADGALRAQDGREAVLAHGAADAVCGAEAAMGEAVEEERETADQQASADAVASAREGA